MQIIINIPNQALVDYWEDDDIEDLRTLFDIPEHFTSAISDALRELLPLSASISTTAFDDFKESLKTRIKHKLVEEIDKKLDW